MSQSIRNRFLSDEEAERLYRQVLARAPEKNAEGAVQADPLREVARENLDNLRGSGGSAR